MTELISWKAIIEGCLMVGEAEISFLQGAAAKIPIYTNKHTALNV